MPTRPLVTGAPAITTCSTAPTHPRLWSISSVRKMMRAPRLNPTRDSGRRAYPRHATISVQSTSATLSTRWQTTLQLLSMMSLAAMSVTGKAKALITPASAVCIAPVASACFTAASPRYALRPFDMDASSLSSHSRQKRSQPPSHTVYQGRMYPARRPGAQGLGVRRGTGSQSGPTYVSFSIVAEGKDTHSVTPSHSLTLT